MKITSKKVDDLSQILTMTVAAADYEQARKKKLAEVSKKVEMPGFRKGHVPASLIEKMYGESALGEAVNTVVGEALQKYVADKKLNIIGEPLPVEEKLDQEWKAGNDFKFQFELGLNPEIALELDKKDEVVYYNINVTETEKKKLIEGYKKQQEMTAAAAKEQGQEAPAAMSDEDLAKQVDAQLKEDYKSAAEFRFEKEVKDFCVAKAGVQVPEKFLRRWLIVANEGKFTEEDIDKDFAGFIADYKWQLVMAELTKKFGIKLEEKDLTEEAKNWARYQYSMYGIMNAPEDALENFAKNILQDQNNIQRIVENCQSKKVIAAIKEQITVKSKKISADKFRELK